MILSAGHRVRKFVLREGNRVNMYNLDEILIQSVKSGASDIHLTTGRPPSYRIDGVLAPIEGERLTPQMLEELLMPLMDVRHRGELWHLLCEACLSTFRNRNSLESLQRLWR